MKAVLLAVALSCVLTSPSIADKITADPNAGAAAATDAPSVSDAEQMARKITYEGGYKRLRAACQEIKELAGIRLSCGQNSSDWRVRDVPVVVCARDVPAGDLLQAISACAHAQFSRLKVAGENEKDASYAIFRTRKGQEAIDAPAKARLRAARERAKWAWDALSAYANLPESKTVPGGVDARLVGTLLASLGPATRDSVLDGSIIKLELRNPAAEHLYEALWERWRAGNQESTALRPDPARCYVKLVYSEDLQRAFGELRLFVSSFPPEETRGFVSFATGWRDTCFSGTSWAASIYGLAQRLIDAKVEGLPAPPARSIAFPRDESTPGPPFEPLVKPEDWDLPVLKSKANLSMPSDPNTMTFADVIGQLARASGLTIACEDFRSHKDARLMGMPLGAKPDATVAEVLRGVFDYKWFIDRKNKILIGWEGNWPERHALLVPEKVISNLETAMKGRGADLDDVAPLILMSRRQYEEWIFDSRDFSHIEIGSADYLQPLWWLYDTLSPDQRRMAKSESGFPLAALPPARFDEFAARMARLYDTSVPFRLGEETEQGKNLRQAVEGLSLPTDAVLKIASRPLKRLRVSVIESAERRFSTVVDAPPGVAKRNYAISLEGGSGDRSYKLGGDWLDPNFPILASDRKTLLDIVAARKK